MKKYFISLLSVLILCSCTDKKEIKIINYYLDDDKMNVCFNHNMEGLTVNYSYTKVNGKPFGINMFMEYYFFTNHDSCYSINKNSWDDEYLKTEDSLYWRTLKTEDIDEVKYVILENLFDTVSSGVFYPNKKYHIK